MWNLCPNLVCAFQLHPVYSAGGENVAWIFIYFFNFNWSHLTEDRVFWQVFVNTVIYFSVL
jgi:hypothetical protein